MKLILFLNRYFDNTGWSFCRLNNLPENNHVQRHGTADHGRQALVGQHVVEEHPQPGNQQRDVNDFEHVVLPEDALGDVPRPPLHDATFGGFEDKRELDSQRRDHVDLQQLRREQW